MAMMATFDIPIPSSTALFGGIAADGDEYVRCSRCTYGGCDVRVQGCGCCLHARCAPLKPDGGLTHCPQCNRPTNGLILFPMSFREIDEARKTVAALASTGRRGRKRKSMDSGNIDEKGTYVSERRTGRWTTEEMSYCDKLIDQFEAGNLPIVDGIKLNEFLGNMLKSKQSRLTKKMKHAKLSTKTFQKNAGFLIDLSDAREFSDLEDSFFHSLQCHQERAEIKFHMQKEWRELFSNYCLSIGQPLDADAWLSSVEEMDRRASHAKDAARMARRKLMMGFALRTDSKNPDQGVFIESVDAEKQAADESAAAALLGAHGTDTEEVLSMLQDKASTENKGNALNASPGNNQGAPMKTSVVHSAPFLSKAIAYMHRHNVPFEHIDLWVPSFVPTSETGTDNNGTTCRLCYAGSATVDYQIGPEGKCNVPLSDEEHFMLHAFGDYSQKFSFDVGCGLPGRVYQSGSPTWEQSVQNAPHGHFERCGGALQWGVKTVVGIPIASPNVGRIVVVLYSRHDRDKDQELVGRLSEEFTRLMPSPKWKLVVDVGEPEVLSPVSNSAVNNMNNQTMASSEPVGHQQNNASTQSIEIGDILDKDTRIDEVVSLLGEFMPSDPTSPLSSFLPGFMSLRLMLLRPSKSPAEEEQIRTVLGSYSSYSLSGLPRNDVAVRLARDYMFLNQQHQMRSHPQSQQQQQQEQQQQQYLHLGQSAIAHGAHQMLRASQQQQQPPGYCFFGMANVPGGSNANPNFHNSPALAPIPGSGNGTDTVSIVSN